jgi:hypothetical protein
VNSIVQNILNNHNATEHLKENPVAASPQIRISLTMAEMERSLFLSQADAMLRRRFING